MEGGGAKRGYIRGFPRGEGLKKQVGSKGGKDERKKRD
jgi:hypothetical protein